MSAKKISEVTDKNIYWRFSDDVLLPGFSALAPEVVPGSDLPPPVPLDLIPTEAEVDG